MRSLSFSAGRLAAFALFVAVTAAFSLCFAGGKEAGLEIYAIPKEGKGPMWVYLEPKANNLKEPLKFHWYFGDGNESEEMIPRPHYYEFGKYNLVLEATDGDGRVYTAGINISADLPG